MDIRYAILTEDQKVQLFDNMNKGIFENIIFSPEDAKVEDEFIERMYISRKQYEELQ
jgi:hypothetical protein